MLRVRARHILVPSEAEGRELKELLARGEAFEALARAYSSCPSGASGGELGEFGQGDMVPEFEEAVVSAAVGEVLGPVQTCFGYHLIEVLERR